MTCTLIRVDTGQPFVKTATIVNNDDGSVSFKLPEGPYVGQEPNQYGVRHDGQETQQYQRAMLTGDCATFLTREGDMVCGYVCFIGQVFPA